MYVITDNVVNRYETNVVMLYAHTRYQPDAPQKPYHPPYRLPLTVIPINYALRLQPMLVSPFTLFGTVDIEIEVG